MKKLKKQKLISDHSEAFDLPEEAIPTENAGVGGDVGKLMERINRIKSGVKPFPWKTVFSGRNLLIAGCVAIIGVAGYLNIRFYSPTDSEVEAAQKGESALEQASAAEEEDYFAVAVMNREKVRDEALDTLRTVAESETSSEAEKQDAYTAMNRLADESTYEVNIENLVRAKGFEDCVAVISDKSANVIVGADIEDLGAAEVAQIKEIVYLESGVLPTNIKIIQKD